MGRLLEIRGLAGYRSVADVHEHFARIAEVLSSVPEVVIVTDWRRCPLMSSEAAEELKLRMMANNQRVLRSAALVPQDSPIAVLQFLRVVREANHPSRRLFSDAPALVQWLGEILSPSELVALREFVA